MEIDVRTLRRVGQGLKGIGLRDQRECEACLLRGLLRSSLFAPHSSFPYSLPSSYHCSSLSLRPCSPCALVASRPAELKARRGDLNFNIHGVRARTRECWVCYVFLPTITSLPLSCSVIIIYAFLCLVYATSSPTPTHIRPLPPSEREFEPPLRPSPPMLSTTSLLSSHRFHRLLIALYSLSLHALVLLSHSPSLSPRTRTRITVSLSIDDLLLCLRYTFYLA